MAHPDGKIPTKSPVDLARRRAVIAQFARTRRYQDRLLAQAANVFLKRRSP